MDLAIPKRFFFGELILSILSRLDGESIAASIEVRNLNSERFDLGNAGEIQ